MVDEPVVSYDLKEILSEIRTDQKTGFAELRVLVGAKADKTDLDGMRADLVAHRADDNQRLTKIETSLRDQATVADAVKSDTAQRAATRALRWKVFYAVVTVIAISAGTLLGLFH